MSAASGGGAVGVFGGGNARAGGALCGGGGDNIWSGVAAATTQHAGAPTHYQPPLSHAHAHAGGARGHTERAPPPQPHAEGETGVFNSSGPGPAPARIGAGRLTAAWRDPPRTDGRPHTGSGHHASTGINAPAHGPSSTLAPSAESRLHADHRQSLNASGTAGGMARGGGGVGPAVPTSSHPPPFDEGIWGVGTGGGGGRGGPPHPWYPPHPGDDGVCTDTHPAPPLNARRNYDDGSHRGHDHHRSLSGPRRSTAVSETASGVRRGGEEGGCSSGAPIPPKGVHYGHDDDVEGIWNGCAAPSPHREWGQEHRGFDGTDAGVEVGALYDDGQQQQQQQPQRRYDTGGRSGANDGIWGAAGAHPAAPPPSYPPSYPPLPPEKPSMPMSMPTPSQMPPPPGADRSHVGGGPPGAGGGEYYRPAPVGAVWGATAPHPHPQPHPMPPSPSLYAYTPHDTPPMDRERERGSPVMYTARSGEGPGYSTGVDPGEEGSTMPGPHAPPTMDAAHAHPPRPPGAGRPQHPDPPPQHDYDDDAQYVDLSAGASPPRPVRRVSPPPPATEQDPADWGWGRQRVSPARRQQGRGRGPGGYVGDDIHAYLNPPPAPVAREVGCDEGQQPQPQSHVSDPARRLGPGTGRATPPAPRAPSPPLSVATAGRPPAHPPAGRATPTLSQPASMVSGGEAGVASAPASVPASHPHPSSSGRASAPPPVVMGIVQPPSSSHPAAGTTQHTASRPSSSHHHPHGSAGGVGSRVASPGCGIDEPGKPHDPPRPAERSSLHSQRATSSGALGSFAHTHPYSRESAGAAPPPPQSGGGSPYPVSHDPDPRYPSEDPVAGGAMWRSSRAGSAVMSGPTEGHVATPLASACFHDFPAGGGAPAPEEEGDAPALPPPTTHDSRHDEAAAHTASHAHGTGVGSGRSEGAADGNAPVEPEDEPPRPAPGAGEGDGEGGGAATTSAGHAASSKGSRRSPSARSSASRASAKQPGASLVSGGKSGTATAASASRRSSRASRVTDRPPRTASAASSKHRPPSSLASSAKKKRRDDSEGERRRQGAEEVKTKDQAVVDPPPRVLSGTPPGSGTCSDGEDADFFIDEAGLPSSTVGGGSHAAPTPPHTALMSTTGDAHAGGFGCHDDEGDPALDDTATTIGSNPWADAAKPPRLSRKRQYTDNINSSKHYVAGNIQSLAGMVACEGWRSAGSPYRQPTHPPPLDDGHADEQLPDPSKQRVRARRARSNPAARRTASTHTRGRVPRANTPVAAAARRGSVEDGGEEDGIADPPSYPVSSEDFDASASASASADASHDDAADLEPAGCVTGAAHATRRRPLGGPKAAFDGDGGARASENPVGHWSPPPAQRFPWDHKNLNREDGRNVNITDGALKSRRGLVSHAHPSQVVQHNIFSSQVPDPNPWSPTVRYESRYSTHRDNFIASPPRQLDPCGLDGARRKPVEPQSKRGLYGHHGQKGPSASRPLEQEGPPFPPPPGLKGARRTHYAQHNQESRRLF